MNQLNPLPFAIELKIVALMKMVFQIQFLKNATKQNPRDSDDKRAKTFSSEYNYYLVI